MRDWAPGADPRFRRRPPRLLNPALRRSSRFSVTSTVLSGRSTPGQSIAAATGNGHAPGAPGGPTVVAGNPDRRAGTNLRAGDHDSGALLGARARCFGGVPELLAGVLVTVEDVRLDAAIPSLPGSEIDVHFSARLGLTRRAREVHDEFMRPSAFGNAASLPQELLQVEDLVGIADIDVHAAGRSEVAANRVARLTVVPNAGVSIGPLAAVLAQAFRPRASA